MADRKEGYSLREELYVGLVVYVFDSLIHSLLGQLLGNSYSEALSMLQCGFLRCHIYTYLCMYVINIGMCKALWSNVLD